ncbi:ferric iron uptake transcriptional regulator [Microvirgula aerodenitrificans]|uniref:Ferric uptake regulation protein n=2 Tax=Aquaspirillaceae TaxID=2897176 RepID=A0A2S0PDW2_9NEIS|nr:ferric iron uptake transcriptional regulator [Microvirgula aerodenitrificans]
MMNQAEQLKSIGLKATGPRLKILNLFESSTQGHLSAEDVYRKLLAEHIDVGLATVYRVLTQFEQAGILMRHHFESGRAVYELNHGHHHDHLVCLDCGRVVEFFEPELETLQDRIAERHGFAIEDHALYLYAKCQKVNCEHRNLETEP